MVFIFQIFLGIGFLPIVSNDLVGYDIALTTLESTALAISSGSE